MQKNSIPVLESMTLEERLEYMTKTGMSQNADEPVHSPAASPEHKPTQKQKSESESGAGKAPEKPSGLASLLKTLKEMYHFQIRNIIGGVPIIYKSCSKWKGINNPG